MQIEIEFTPNPIPANLPTIDKEIGAFGAFTEFRGIIRGEEHGSEIKGIEYEIYEPMARRQLEEIIRVLYSTHPCRSAKVIHRKGRVPVGEASIYIGITGSHREETYLMVSALMKRIKLDVPIWKVRSYK